MSKRLKVISPVILLLLCNVCRSAEPKTKLPDNLAPKAKISANSQYSKDYEPKFVADGQIPKPTPRTTPARPGASRATPTETPPS